MQAASNVGARNRLAMAAEARVQCFRRTELGKRDDGRLAAARLHVRLSRTVAALAPGVFGRFLARRDALVMGVLEERRSNVRMTRLTDIASDVISSQRPRWRKREKHHPNPKRIHAPTIAK